MFYNSRTGEVRVFWKLLVFAALVLLGHFAALIAAVVIKATLLLSAKLTMPSLAAVVVLISSWICVRQMDGLSIRATGVGLDRPWFLHLALGALVGCGLLATAWVVYWLGGWATSSLRPDLFAQPVVVIISVAFCISVGVYEELLLRGYAFQVLARWKLPVAIVVYGLLFVGIHLPNKGGFTPLAMVNIFLAHLFFVACYLKTRSLWLPIGIHAGWNFAVAFLFGMPLSGRVPIATVITTDLQPSIWTGNEFGPEAGLVVTILFATATVAAWFLLKQRRVDVDLLTSPLRRAEAQPPRPQSRPPRAVDQPALAPQLQRVLAIDVLRGAAILGILPMNMQLFAMLHSAFLNPYACAWTDNVNVTVWVLQHVLIGYKDLMVFSMLFGAGIVMLETRAGGQGAAALHYRRMIVLLGIGLVHAYLVWSSDILVTYALSGCVVYLLRNLKPALLLVLGAGAYVLPLLLLLVLHFAVPRMNAEIATSVYSIFEPTAEQVADHEAAYGGSWLGQFKARAAESFAIQTIMFVSGFGWVAGGMMLWGIGLYRLGLFTDRAASRTYVLLVAGAALVGLPLLITGMWQNFSAGWRPEYSLFAGRLFSDLAAPIMALGWIGLLALICRYGKLKWLTSPVSCVGRMALTNYLAHSVMCSLIFYGHGLGLLNRVDRVGQMLITIGMWTLTLIWSVLWLRRFRWGPVEWLWRTLYGAGGS